HHVVDLVGRDDVRGQRVVHLVIGEEALLATGLEEVLHLLALGDRLLLDLVLHRVRIHLDRGGQLFGLLLRVDVVRPGLGGGLAVLLQLLLRGGRGLLGPGGAVSGCALGGLARCLGGGLLLVLVLVLLLLGRGRGSGLGLGGMLRVGGLLDWHSTTSP